MEINNEQQQISTQMIKRIDRMNMVFAVYGYQKSTQFDRFSVLQNTSCIRL